MMTINEALTPLGDGFRNLYRTSDKYSAADMAKLLSGLEIHNFLDDGQSYDGKPDINGYYQKGLTGIDINKWNKFLLGKSVIFSFDAEWSGFNENINSQKRFGFELQTTAEDGSVHYNGTWFYPTTPSGKQYCATKMKIYDKPIQHVDYGSMYNHINNDATVKITNVKMYIDPLGGVVPPNLFDIAGMKLTNANRDGTLFAFEDNSNPNVSVYTNFLVQNNIPLKKNTAYQLSFSIRGTGTIVTYVYGNNSSGNYVDNVHWWGLTNQWQEFKQYLPPESVPLNANFNFRSATNCSGEVTNLKLTPVE